MLWNKFPPVIMLHHVSDDVVLDVMKPYCINHASFLRLLDVLEAEGYTTTNFKELSGGSYNKKKVILTFDDCYKALWDFAIPELQKRNMTAVFYMPTAYVNGSNDWDIEKGKPALRVMDETDLKKLTDVGMEVGSHAHQHVSLGTCSEEEVRMNLVQSKQILEKITGKKILSIAYPFGSIPVDNRRLLTETGYSYGLSIYTPNETQYDIRRWIYHDGDDVARIKKKLSLLYRILRSVKDKIGK